MSTQINLEELKTLIANGIKEQNLHEALPEDAVEKIKEKILAMRDKEAVESIPKVVSELDIPSLNYSNNNDEKFPDERDLVPSPEQQVNMSGETQTFDVPAGSVSTEQPSEPTMGYTPELPEMLQKAAPGELFVFQYNDIGESGENLSNKPMRLMNDPDVKKSMHDLWIQEGKTKAKIFVAKFEEIGEIDFNYADGTSKFVEKASLPDYAGGPEYKENPYAAESMPQIDASTQDALETYVKSSVDLEKVVHDIVMGIVKDSLLTNTEQAVKYPLGAIDPNDPNRPTDEMGHYIQEDIAPVEDRFGNATDNAQSVKPMEEGEMPTVAICPSPEGLSKGEMPMMLTKDEFESFQLTMEEIAKDDDYQKVKLPNELNEAIKSGDKKMLVQENEHIQKWEFKGTEYFTSVNRLSKTKGYIKS